MKDANDILLEVSGLRTYFHTDDGVVRAVDGASFTLRRGGALAIVGESGCGKSVTAYSILKLIQPPGRIEGGRIVLRPADGRAIDVTALPEGGESLRRIRGGLVGMIFQEPMTALSPVHTIGSQIAEAILVHRPVGTRQAYDTAAEVLGKVGIPGPRLRLKQYPHELSGGMRQRAVIAMALACGPELVIADEPTTALDVTIQAQIMGLLKRLRSGTRTSILLITHDLGVVAQMAEDVAVMYLGRIVESAAVRPLMKSPRHPYTMGLLASLPSLARRHEPLASIGGAVPSMAEIPPGCPFHPRCPHAQRGRCDVGGPPELRDIAGGHKVACPRAEEIA
jgi:oligopeptide/dipeptide ABC transporter ATP-binding protein